MCSNSSFAFSGREENSERKRVRVELSRRKEKLYTKLSIYSVYHIYVFIFVFYRISSNSTNYLANPASPVSATFCSTLRVNATGSMGMR